MTDPATPDRPPPPVGPPSRLLRPIPGAAAPPEPDHPPQPDHPPHDRQSVEVMEQAIRLLEAGTIQEPPRLPAENADDPSEPVVFPLPDG